MLLFWYQVSLKHTLKAGSGFQPPGFCSIMVNRCVRLYKIWLPLAHNVDSATEQLIEQHNPAWHMEGGSGLYPVWLTDVALAGFSNIETFSFYVALAYSHIAWRGRLRASAGVAASLPPEQVVHFDAELATLLQSQFPDDPLAIPHRVFAAICRKP